MDIRIQTTPLSTANIRYERDESWEKIKTRDFYLQIKNIIFHWLSSKEEQYKYILDKATEKLSEKVWLAIEDAKKQIDTIFIDFGNWKKDVIEIWENLELIY
jgi:hypothetical protein